MNIGIFEDSGYQSLLPLTWLRPAFDLRCGMERLIDRQRACAPGAICRLFLRPEVVAAFGSTLNLATPDPAEDWLLVNARLWPDGPLPELAPRQLLTRGPHVIAARVAHAEAAALHDEFFLDEGRVRSWAEQFAATDRPDLTLMSYPWDLLAANPAALRSQLRAGGVREGRVAAGAHLVNESEIHIARDAVVKPGVVIDAEDGPVHIAEGALIEPNAVIQGPVYVGPGSIIRPNAIIRPDTAIGPMCRVGGEVAESILWGYANKQHEGFLGHSYLGAWVNVGAGTTTSDLKNTYGAIRVFLNGVATETGQQFLGSIVGDHSKLGICSILPTGCIVGVASNLFRSGPAPKFVPSFSWCTDAGTVPYHLDRAVQLACRVMQRRQVELSEAERALLTWAAWTAPQVEAAGWQAFSQGDGRANPSA